MALASTDNPQTLDDGATAQALQEIVIEEAIPVQTDPKKGGITLWQFPEDPILKKINLKIGF